MKDHPSEYSLRKKVPDCAGFRRTHDHSGTILSEENYRDLVESSGSIIMKTDKDLNIIYVNDFGLEFFGYSMEELFCKNVVGTTIPKRDDAGQDLEVMAEELKSNPKSFGTNVHQNMRKNGELVWISWTNKPKYDENGDLAEILAIGNDISKLKRAEQALMDSEKKFRDMFESAPINMALVGFDGTIIDVNNAAVIMHGFSSREELLGKNCLELVDKACHQTVMDGFVKALEDGHISDVELVQIRKDGQKINTLASSTVLFDTQSRPYAFIAMIIDITERKRLENELKEYNETLEERVLLRTTEIQIERKRLFDVLETLPAMICLLSEDYQVEFVNRPFRNKFGEPHGRHCYEYWQDRKAPCEFCETSRVIKDRASHRWESTLRDGTIVDINDYPFTDADGSRLILKMYIDVTKQRADEAELRKFKDNLERLNKELVRSNQELESFAYVATHDLQEPLRMVTSFTQLLESKYHDKFDDSAREYMGYVVDGGKRMYELINGLLSYSRVSRRKINFSNVDLNNVIDIVKSNLAHIMHPDNCTMECQKLPVIEADELMMIQLFQNLVSNAIKFSKKPAHIYISCKPAKGHHVISVKDEGIGIDPIYFEKIFQIFKRLMPRYEYEGTGIGLAICKRIIENHNGNIWVESEPGKGSVFHFTLPKKRGRKSVKRESRLS